MNTPDFPNPLANRKVAPQSVYGDLPTNEASKLSSPTLSGVVGPSNNLNGDDVITETPPTEPDPEPGTPAATEPDPEPGTSQSTPASQQKKTRIPKPAPLSSASIRVPTTYAFQSYIDTIEDIKILARAEGKTMKDYLNGILDTLRNRNKEYLEAAKTLASKRIKGV